MSVDGARGRFDIFTTEGSRPGARARPIAGGAILTSCAILRLGAIAASVLAAIAALTAALVEALDASLDWLYPMN